MNLKTLLILLPGVIIAEEDFGAVRVIGQFLSNKIQEGGALEKGLKYWVKVLQKSTSRCDILRGLAYLGTDTRTSTTQGIPEQIEATVIALIKHPSRYSCPLMMGDHAAMTRFGLHHPELYTEAMVARFATHINAKPLLATAIAADNLHIFYGAYAAAMDLRDTQSWDTVKHVVKAGVARLKPAMDLADAQSWETVEQLVTAGVAKLDLNQYYENITKYIKIVVDSRCEQISVICTKVKSFQKISEVWNKDKIDVLLELWKELVQKIQRTE